VGFLVGFFFSGREEGQAETAAVGERGPNCGSGSHSSEGGGASGDSQNASGLDGNCSFVLVVYVMSAVISI
jgi:hypothetical protein